MKNTLEKVRWILRQGHPFVLLLVLTTTLGSISALSGIFMALLSKKLIDSITSGQVYRIFQYIPVISIIILTDTGLRAVVTIIATHNSVRITNNIQVRIYSRLMQTRWMEFSKHHSGDILTRLTSDADVITEVLTRTLPSIVSLAVLLTGALSTLLYFEPLLAVLIFTIGPASILISRFYGQRLKKLYKKIQKIEASYRSFLHESVQNVAIIKAFCFETGNINHIKELQDEKLKLVLQRSRMSAVTNSLLLLGSWMGYFLVFIWGALNTSRGIANLGTFTALLQLVGNIQGPFSGLAHTFPQLVSALASAERLMELESYPLDVYDFSVPDINTAGIELNNVSYGYTMDTPILKHVTTTINSGETVALIGMSGEGKTTLIRLLLALIYPEKGHIYVTKDQEKIEISASCRKLMAYVPQGNTLFSGTIEDNLRYGCPTATDTELEDALRAACAWEFIVSLQDRVHTLIGEHGLGLSEGQAQRLAIARALLCKAPILILDEATSALDINTEIQVLQSIRNLRSTRTCIIITHRPTALKICHRIFKIETGRLIELSGQITEDPAIEAV